MEKGGTPRSRMTRSAARQVSTPTRKMDQEDSVDQETSDGIKQNLRKSMRKADTKPKTNGDTSANVEKKKLKTNEDVSDGGESDDSDKSVKQGSSPKSRNHETPSPGVSRKSLRTRRSVTPGPDMELSVSTKLKRSTSESKLETAWTPTNRRSVRAKSESKDFKMKSNEGEKINSLSESKSKFIHRNSTLRLIGKIDEANEEGDTSQDEDQTQKRKSPNNYKVNASQELGEGKQETPETSQGKLEDSKSEVEPKIVISDEINKTETSVLLNSKENMGEKMSPVLPIVTEEECTDSIMNQESNVEQPSSYTCSVSGNGSVDKDKDTLHEGVGVEKISIEVFNCESDKVSTPSSQIMSVDNQEEINMNKTLEETNEKPAADNIEIDVIGVDSESQEMKLSLNYEHSQIRGSDEANDFTLKVPISKACPLNQPKDVGENNNVTQAGVEVQSENTNSVIPTKEETISNDGHIDPIMLSKPDFSAQTDVDNTPKKGISSPIKHDEIAQNDQISEEPLTILESYSTESSNASDINQAMNENGNLCYPEINITDDNFENEEKKLYEKCDGNYNQSEETMATKHEQCNVIEEDDILIEDSVNNPMQVNENKSSYLIKKGEENESSNMEIKLQLEDPHTVRDADNDLVIQYGLSEDTEVITHHPFEDQSVKNTGIKEKDNLHLFAECRRDEYIKDESDSMIIQLSDYKETILDESVLQTKKCSEPCSDEIYAHDNDEDGVSTKTKEDSENDSDIYKGMSDFGTDGDEKKEGSQFDESSSELRSGTGDSEEYVSSVDDEDEEEEDEEANTEADDQHKREEMSDKNIKLSTNQNMSVNDQENNSAGGSKAIDIIPSSPMTYDKALAILNENREKKMDDEEFFDMFTQELNRVSESDSDSDIAIVDEYIMEPEEPDKKLLQKHGNPQPNPKQPQRHPAPCINQSMPPAEHISRDYNPQALNQHSHPAMTRIDYSQDEMYHQYSQCGLQPPNSERGPVLYNQFAPHNHVQDPRFFNPHIPSESNFATTGMLRHPQRPVSDVQMNFPNPPTGLKLRNVNAINCSQSFNRPTLSRHFVGENHEPQSLMETRPPRDPNETQNNIGKNITSAATMTDNNDKSYEAASPKDDKKTSKPILELLGLDKKKLLLLKQVLGLDRRSQSRSKVIKSETSLEQLMKKTKRNNRSKFKRFEKLENKKSLMKHIFESDSISSHKLSREELTATSNDTSPSSSIQAQYSSESSYRGIIDKCRKINLQDGSLSVTLNRRLKKPRHRNKKTKIALSASPDDSSNESQNTRKKSNRNEKRSKHNDCTRSLSTDIRYKRKMTQGKKQTKKQPTLLKLKSGTFTVDSRTTTSQSSDSETNPVNYQLPGPSNYLEKLKKNMRDDINSGKNKLSNIFSQHSIQFGGKGSKRKRDEPSGESDEGINTSRKERARKLRKLPTDLLEKLAQEEENTNRYEQSDSCSEEEVCQKSRKQKKSRKRAKKIKIKSVAAQENYVPCVTAGATQFGLSRLDRDGLTTVAEMAAKFRTDQLYGTTVKRITIMDFKG